MTPNIVQDTSEFYINATKEQPQNWSSFITHTVRNNWAKAEGQGSAWKELSRNNFILAQFDGFYDLNMESSDVQNRLIEIIHNLASIGIKGFRFNNAKHFLIDRDFKDEALNTGIGTSFSVGQYGFYHHHQTTYRPGLGNLLHKFANSVHNATQGDGFLTIRDDVGSKVEVLQINNSSVFGISIPKLNFINKNLKSSPESSKLLNSGFNLMVDSKIDLTTAWMQIPFDNKMFSDKGFIGYPAYKIFINLLPGVQIASLKDFTQGNDLKMNKILKEARESSAFQHGSFDFMTSSNDTAFGYTR